MTKVTITYYGHSCFKVEASGSSIVFDPYEDDSVPGLRLPRGLKADVVSCSHDHADHHAAHLVAETGHKPSFSVTKLTVPHDHHNGAHRGLSDITFLHFPDMVIAHLGDLGRLPTEAEYAELKKADIVLLPCAGYFTINSKEAADVISHLKHPCLKILMHFRKGDKGYEVQETIGQVAKDIAGIRHFDKSVLEVEAGNIPDEIVTLEPMQK